MGFCGVADTLGLSELLPALWELLAPRRTCMEVLSKDRRAGAGGIFSKTLTRTPTALLLRSAMPVCMLALKPPWGSPESRTKTCRDKRLRKE